MNDEDLDLTKLPENSILDTALATATVHKMDKTQFLTEYNTMLTTESLNELLSALGLMGNFDGVHIFFPSHKSKVIDVTYDQMWKWLSAGVIPKKKFIWGNQMVCSFRYGRTPYAAFYRNFNQVEPDFLIFRDETAPEALKHSYHAL